MPLGLRRCHSVQHICKPPVAPRAEAGRAETGARGTWGPGSTETTAMRCAALREHKIRVGVIRLGFSRELTFELPFPGYIKKCAQGHQTFLSPEKSLTKRVCTSAQSSEGQKGISPGCGAETGNHPEALGWRRPGVPGSPGPSGYFHRKHLWGQHISPPSSTWTRRLRELTGVVCSVC